MERVSWDEYYARIVLVVAIRSTCNRGRSGAVLVRDNKIIATGYVGSTPGEPHCDDVGHEMITIEHIDKKNLSVHRSEHCDRTLHAEENAILQCAEFGIAAKGSTLYCTMVPCFRCARRIVRVGIVRVVAIRRYQTDQDTIDLFTRRNIELIVHRNELEEYPSEQKDSQTSS